MDNTLLAFVVLVGLVDVGWYLRPIDQVEWTDTYYGHQN